MPIEVTLLGRPVHLTLWQGGAAAFGIGLALLGGALWQARRAARIGRISLWGVPFSRTVRRAGQPDDFAIAFLSLFYAGLLGLCVAIFGLVLLGMPLWRSGA